MYKRQITVMNETGLHARPASIFVREASKYKSKVSIRRLDGGLEVNAKSIVFLLSMGIGKGTDVEITACGDDEKEAVDGLVTLIEAGFDE